MGSIPFRGQKIFSLPRVVPCFPLLGLTPSGLFMGLRSTIIYTSELILCSTIKLKIAVNKEIDHRKGTLTVTLETTAGFVTIIMPVGIMIGAPVGQITTGGLF